MTQVLLDDLDITDWIAWGTLALPTPADDAPERVISATLDVDGVDDATLMDRLRQLQSKITQATLAARPYGSDTRKVLSIEWGSRGAVKFDILRGALSIPPETITAAHIAQHVAQGVSFALACLPLGRSTAITLPRQYLLYGNEFGTGWTLSEVTVTSNATTGPDGTTSADKLVASTNSALHSIRQNTTTTAAATQYFSVVAKAAEYTRVQIRVRDITNAVIGQVIFDLSTGVVQTISSGTPVIVSLGNGWYRCTVYVANPTAQTQCIVQMVSGVSTTTFTGNGTDGVYVYGAHESDGVNNSAIGALSVHKVSANIAGANAYSIVQGVPGTAPALTELQLDDVTSGGTYIHYLRIARHAALDVSTYAPIIDATTGTDATNTTTGSDYIGGGFARVTTSSAWKQAATFSVPFRALADVYLRCRDSVAATVPFTIDTLDVTTSGGSLPDGAYTYMVALYAGSDLVAISDSRSVTIKNAAGAALTTLDWGDVGTVTNARIYWKRSINEWVYLALASATSAYTHTTEASAITGNPPTIDDVAFPPTLIRVSLKVGSKVVREFDPITANLGQQRWEPLKILSAESFPPHGKREQRADVPVTVVIDVKASGGVGGASFDVDAAVLLNVGETAAELTAWTFLLTATRRWVLDTARDGAASGILLSLADGSVIGMASTTGALTLEPMPLLNHLTFLLTMDSDIYTAGAAAATSWVIIPRWKSIGGVA